MLTVRSTDAAVGTPGRVEATISCDGCARLGTLGLDCDPPIVVRGSAENQDRWLTVVIAELARAAGWQRRMWDHAKFGETWLCPMCVAA